MKRLFLATFCLLSLLLPYLAAAEETTLPRKLLALYDSRYEFNLRSNTTHRLLEMPANRLGYDLEYVDVNRPLPPLDKDTYGIIIWFHHEPIPRLSEYLRWLEAALKSGRKLVVMENMGLGNIDDLSSDDRDRLRYIESRLGYIQGEGWDNLPYNATIISRDKTMVDFERKLAPPFNAYSETRVTPQGKSYLRIQNNDDLSSYSDLVVTGPQGGMAAAGYIYHTQSLRDREITQWYINPFQFLKESLKPVFAPVPDVTTLVGRRIFYAHIDGDGWNNMSQIAEYREQLASSADVIQKEILAGYPDFPFSVGIVAGDVADDCFGSEKSRATARATLALPNVEPSSHTYTHPLFWEFFEHYTLDKEKPFAGAFPKKAGLFSQSVDSLMNSKIHRHQVDEEEVVTARPVDENGLPLPISAEEELQKVLNTYEIPRSYNCIPFDEKHEIQTAKELIQSLAPAGKPIKLLQWSGNTSPYERFIRETREAGMLNINGGESRFDGEYPSYSALYPLGIKIGAERQIYSTASNENTYTNLWTERFFGYRYLVETLRHTETPMRVTPFNIYFHSYSGERQASLQAIKDILNEARKERLVPILSSEYAAIASGFYTTRIEPIGTDKWRIHDRGALQTLRFDHADDKHVDERASTGVLGQSHYQGNLYVFLNPAVDKPEIILINHAPQKMRPPALSLMESRWNVVSAARPDSHSVTLTLQGYGKGEMEWAVPEALPENSTYVLVLKRTDTDETSLREMAAQDGMLTIDFGDISAISPLELSLQPKVQKQ